MKAVLNRLSWRSLSTQLFVFVILPLNALVLVIAFGSVTLHQRAMRALVSERDVRAARAAATSLADQLTRRSATLRILAWLAQMDRESDELDDLLGSFSDLSGDFDHGLALFLESGENLGATGDIDMWQALMEPEAADVLRELVDEPATRFVVWPHPKTAELLLLASAQTTTSGPIAAGAFSAVSVGQRALADLFNPTAAPAAIIVDSDFTILYQIGMLPDDFEVRRHPGVIEALAGQSGAIFLPVEDREHVIAFSPVEPGDWALLIEEPWEAVASPLLRTTQVAPLVLVPAVLLALAVFWLGWRQVIEPLRQLETKARALTWGDYQAVMETVGGIEEIRRLQTELVYLAEKVNNAQQSLRGYVEAITAAQEEERRRLALELHDETIQSLIALNQRIHLARLQPEGPVRSAALAEIQTMTEQTIQDLRRITRALRPIYLEDLGLVPALEMLAREVSHAAGIDVRFQAGGPGQRLPATAELALYRIAQEGLNNVVRHSAASRATLQLNFSPDQVELRISDNGCGFEMPESPAAFAPSRHFGLLGMHERAELIGARLTIKSAPGEGTVLTVHLNPLVAAQDALQ